MFKNSLLIFALLAPNVLWYLAVWYYKKKLEAVEYQTQHSAKLAKDDAVAREGASRATIKGQVAEQIATILPGFPFCPSDFRFIGQPIDYIVFVGLSGAKEGLGDIKEVVIGDIKMGNSRLSPHQRMIKQAVQEGRVRWETLHVNSDFTIERGASR